MKFMALIASAGVAASAMILNLNGPVANDEGSTTYSVDSVHSSVVFGVTHLGSSRFYGRFNNINGRFRFDPADPARTRVEVEIDADSVDTKVENRDKHLKSPDFFNVKQFPKITFKSKSLEKKGDGWVLKGDLTLHGVTKEVAADFEWIGTGEMRGTKRGGFEATFKINRSDHDMNFMVGPLGDEVKLIVSLEGSAQ